MWMYTWNASDPGSFVYSSGSGSFSSTLCMYSKATHQHYPIFVVAFGESSFPVHCFLVFRLLAPLERLSVCLP